MKKIKVIKCCYKKKFYMGSASLKKFILFYQLSINQPETNNFYKYALFTGYIMQNMISASKLYFEINNKGSRIRFM